MIVLHACFGKISHFLLIYPLGACSFDTYYISHTNLDVCASFVKILTFFVSFGCMSFDCCYILS